MSAIECLKEAGYNRAMKSVLLSDYVCIVGAMVAHRVEIRIDVWRRFNHPNVELTCGLHHIVVQGRYDLEPVAETNVEQWLDFAKLPYLH